MTTLKHVFGRFLLSVIIIGLIAYFLLPLVSQKMLVDVLAATSGTMSITGTLLGLAVSWMGQSKTMLRDMDYDRAEELFNEIGMIQREMILRWGLIIVCSLITVAISASLKSQSATTSSPPPMINEIATALAVAFLLVGLVYVARIFSSMIAVHELKVKLDKHERDELRKQRNAR